jgi:FkbM family methyltransferase
MHQKIFKTIVKLAHIAPIKSLLVRFFPISFSLLHRNIQANKDSEFALLPYLCDPLKDSIDVGVLYGGYARELIKYSKRLWMVEANPEQIKFLQKAFPDQINNIFHTAASHFLGTTTLRVPVKVPGNATVEELNLLSKHSNYKEYTVKVDTLDNLITSSNIGFIKIDVEGHELNVLQGCERIIIENRPVFLVECMDEHRKNAILDLKSFFDKLDYEIFYLFNDEFNSILTLSNININPLNRNNKDFINNFIALPTEKKGDIFKAINEKGGIKPPYH